LLRLKIQRLGLGRVRLGNELFVKAEVPRAGCRAPFGAGSYPLGGGFTEDSNPADMLAAFVEWATRHELSKAFFASELATVNRRLRQKAKNSGRRHWTATDRAGAARELYHEALAKIAPPVSRREIEKVLRADPHGHLFSKAPPWVKREYALGIECYGSRTATTMHIAVWLRIVGLDAVEIEEVLLNWLSARRHLSRDLHSRPEWVKETLPALIEATRNKAQPRARLVTVGDVRWLVEHGQPARVQRRRVRRRRARAHPGRVPLSHLLRRPRRDQGPKKKGTWFLHRLQLGFFLIEFLRAQKGKHNISSLLLQKHGGRDYSDHLRIWQKVGLIEEVDYARDGKARTYKLLLKGQTGELVSSLEEGLGRSLSEKELKVHFGTRPSLVEKIAVVMKSSVDNHERFIETDLTLDDAFQA
jgi:hypothetical protein